MSNRQEKHDLENIIDSLGLSTTLELIADICYEKSAHIQTNWQDKVTSRPWEKAAKRIETISSKTDV